MVDTGQHTKIEEELKREKKFSQNVIATIPASLLILDKDLGIKSANRSFYILLQTKPKKVIGSKIGDILGDEDGKLSAELTKLFATEDMLENFELHYQSEKLGERLFNITARGMIIAEEEEEEEEELIVIEDITERKQAEEALRESNRRFRDITENASEWIWETNADGKYTYASPVVEKILGYEPEEVLKKHFYDLFHPDDREELKKAALEVFAKKQPFREFVNRNIRKNGKTVWLSTSGVPILDEEGSLLGYRGADIDITERKRMEEALRESEKKYRTLFQDSKDAIFITTQDGKLVDANQSFLKLFGYTTEEAIELDVRKTYVNPDDRLRYQQEMEQKGAVRDFELKLKKKDGTELDCLLTATVRRSKDGVILGYHGFIRDITERKRMEKALRQSEEFSSSLLDNSPIPIHVVNPDTSIRYVNTALERLTGFSFAEVIGRKPPYPWWLEETLSKTSRDFSEAMHKGVERLEVHFQKKHGERFWVEITGTPVIQDGEFKYYLTNWVDITERKRMQAVLRQSEEKYRGLVENIDAGICRVTPAGEGRHIEANPAMSGILGYSREELLRMNVSDVYQDPSDRKKFADKVCTRGSVKNEELKLRRKDGTPIIVSNTATAVRDEKGNIIYIDAILEDITKRKQAEERLRAQKELTDKILASTPDAVLVIDRHLQIHLVNSAFCETFKIKRAKAEGKLLSDVLPVEILSEAVSKVFTTGEPQLNLEFRHKVDGDERILVGQIIGMRREEEEEEEELLLILRDITLERVTEEQLYHTRALTSIGEMASGIAHEINNPLTGVIGFAQLLMQKDIPKDIEEDVKIINEGAQRVASIVKRLLVFSRQQKPERIYVNINEVIEVTLNLRKYELETGNIQVTTQLDPELPWTMADAGQLQQVFLNIIINAESEMQAAHGRGKLLLKTEKADNTIRISFKDDGPGIARKNMDKLFNPFFTTKKPGEGTGLGLSICHGIVTEHSGRIYAESKLGKGATFVVELPIITEAKQLGLAEPTADEFKKVAGARILVIDDEPAVLQFLSQLLTGEGYQVETIDNADDALKKIKSESYSLIMLDIKMPGISGIELYERLQKIDRSLTRRLVFITGDVMAADTRDFLSKTKADYIAKPFDSEQLRKEIERKLHQGA